MEAIGRSFRLERPSGSASPAADQVRRGANRRGIRPVFSTPPTFDGALDGAARAQDARMEGARTQRRYGSHRDAHNSPGTDTRAEADRRAGRQRAEEQSQDRHVDRGRAADARREEARVAEVRSASGQDQAPVGTGEAVEAAYPVQEQPPAGATGVAPSAQAKTPSSPTGWSLHGGGASGAGHPAVAGTGAGRTTSPSMPGHAITPGGAPGAGGEARIFSGQGLAAASATTGKSGPAEAGADPAQTAADVADAEATKRADRGAEVLRQIRLNLTGGAREVSLQLRPAELGHVHIRLGIRGGEAHAEVTVESQETLDLLRGHLPELRAALAERGLDTGEIKLELGDGNGAWGAGREEAEAAGQRLVAVESLEALAESTNEAWTDWLDPDVGVDLYA